MPVFGADLWASDWNDMTPQQELDLLMGRLRGHGHGIILLHDTRQQTAEMIPALLAKLKEEHFKLVHIVPGDHLPRIVHAKEGWVSQTEATLQRMGINGVPRRVRTTAQKAATPANKNVPPAETAPMMEQTDAPAPAAKP